MAIPRLAWAEISTSAIKNNLQVIREKIGTEVKLMAVVKANAYGHGAVEFAKVCQDSPVDMFGVSSFYEARQLREGGIKSPIVILGFTPVENFKDAVEFNITTTLKNLDVAKALSTQARREGKTAKIWLKVDTGMHRLGLAPEQVLYFVKKLQDFPSLELEGIFTHFADSDEDKQFTQGQLAKFKEILIELEKEGINIPIKSAANSGAVFGHKDSHFNLVRPGLSLYGVNPDSKTSWSKDLRRVLEFKTEVTQIHELVAGESVGYGRTFKTTRPNRIATLAVGYGDGFRRAPSNWAEVLIRGHKVPVIGRVSMDQAAVDITDIDKDIRVGEEVVLIGKSGKEEITVEEVAQKLDTISYEVLVSLAERVTRIYK